MTPGAPAASVTVGWFAGVHSAAGRPAPSRAVRRLAEASSGQSFASGELTLALPTGTPPPVHDFCAIAGRIHGVGELARELSIAPASDPAIPLLEGFRRFGPQVLARLRGSFALLIWDAAGGCGLVGQDLTALSAVFVAQTDGGLAFATEIRELLALLPSRPAPDPVSVTHLLGETSAPPGRTLFRGIARLQGGSCVVLDHGRSEVRQYWAPRYEGTLALPDEQLLSLLSEQLTVAVGRAVGTAERTGVLLSGGLDSSVVACVAAKQGIDVRGYSATFPAHPELDESPYVESVASRWGIPVFSSPMHRQGSFCAALEYLHAWEVPVLGIGYVLERDLIRAMASDGATAVIDGQGGDELFATSLLLAPHLIRRGRLLASFRTIRTTPSTSTIASPRALIEIWKRFALKPAFPLALIEARRRRRGPTPSPPWLVPSARQTYADSVDEWSWRRRAGGPLWWRWLADLLLVGPSAVGRADYLRHRTAMGGLSGGSPLLDFDLAQLVLSMPPQLAYDRATDRPLVRRAMQGVLPEAVRKRTDKSNLLAYYRGLLAGPDLRWIRRVLRDPRCSVWEFVERDQLDRLLDGIPIADGPPADRYVGVLQTAATVECWLRQQEDPESVASLLDEVSAGDGAEVRPRLESVAR